MKEIPRQTMGRLLHLCWLIAAGIFLALGLRGINYDKILQGFASGLYIWSVPLICIFLFTNVVRAWRWRLLLQTLIRGQSTKATLPIRPVFLSLMIGVMVNYATPRLGEFVRSGLVSYREKLSLGAVFGTVVAERLLDVVALAVFMISIPLFLEDQAGRLLSVVVDPFREAASNSKLGVVLLLLTMGSFILLGIMWSIRARHGALTRRLSNSLRSFRLGLNSLMNSGHSISIITCTLLIWLCYGVMAYIPLIIFGLTGNDGLGVADAWILMLIGAVGMLIPMPGGFGSYHYLTINSLILIWATSDVTAASYAIFTHGIQLILYVSIGFLAALIEGTSWSRMKSFRLEASTEPLPG